MDNQERFTSLRHGSHCAPHPRDTSQQSMLVRPPGMYLVLGGNAAAQSMMFLLLGLWA